MWLWCGIITIAIILVTGGITRLTHSGLSMATWKPITGVIPPINEAQWQEEFSAYKKTPEFIAKNYYFNITQFKSIFWWEYIHRLLGRILALLFIIPFCYFWWKGRFNKPEIRNKVIVVFLLGATQGLIGWLMVKSGLSNEPRVSHIRLAIHLAMAFILISYLLLIVFRLQDKTHQTINPAKKRYQKRITSLYLICLAQIIYGALLAGLQAGTLYGTFPMMGEEWIPEIIINSLKTDGLSSLISFPPTVQFIHRILGIIFLVSASFLAFKANAEDYISPSLRKSLRIVLIITIIQVILGISTLVLAVPIILALIHQATALILCAFVVKSYFHAKYSRKKFTDN